MEPQAPHQKNKLAEYSTFGLAIVVLLLIPVVLLTKNTAQSTKTYAASAPADINHDGKINLDDVAVIRQDIVNGTYDKNADLNGDGKVDEKDIEYFYETISLQH